MKNGAAKRVYRPALTGLPECYFDSAKNCYWIKDARDTWIQVSESGAKRLFRSHGVAAAVPERKHVSPLDLAVLDVQLEKNVAYAASLAGYSKGVYEITGKRVLVIDSPVLVEGKEGSWSTLATVLEGLLADEHYEQAFYLFGCERKTVSDFCAAIGRERERFDRELLRARYCQSLTIVVEGSLTDVVNANRKRGQLSENAILGTIASWTRRGASVLFAGTVHAAADLAYRILAGQIREIERASKAIEKAEATT